MQFAPGNRIYDLSDSIVFHKTREKFGGLSNMAAGYSVNVNNVIIPTVEHLYQACRFPGYPQIQYDILSEPSPMKAKWIGRKFIDSTRSDWKTECFNVMKWCLVIKLSQNWETFGRLLESTGKMNIVELAPKGKIWGAKQTGNKLEGVNALGRLIMKVREEFVYPNIRPYCVQSLQIRDFKLLGNDIDLVCDYHYEQEIRWSLEEEMVLS